MVGKEQFTQKRDRTVGTEQRKSSWHRLETELLAQDRSSYRIQTAVGTVQRERESSSHRTQTEQLSQNTERERAVHTEYRQSIWHRTERESSLHIIKIATGTKQRHVQSSSHRTEREQFTRTTWHRTERKQLAQNSCHGTETGRSSHRTENRTVSTEQRQGAVHTKQLAEKNQTRSSSHGTDSELLAENRSRCVGT